LLVSSPNFRFFCSRRPACALKSFAIAQRTPEIGHPFNRAVLSATGVEASPKR
jgi:hypothetical protein